jgi:hypothetical protein
MTEMKHFDDVFIFAEPVINKNGTMLQFSDTGPFSDYATHMREAAKKIYMVE